MEEEIWKEHPVYKGLMASSLGRIKLPETEAIMPHGGIRKYITKPTYGCITRSSKTAKHEYYGIMNRRLGNLKIHKVICEAFHGLAPEGKPNVLHEDGNALNNREDNLKWGTQKENLNHETFIEYCKSRTGKNNPYVKGRIV